MHHIVDAEFSAYVLNLDTLDKIEVTDYSGTVYTGTVEDNQAKPFSGPGCACRVLLIRSKGGVHHGFQYIVCDNPTHMFGHIPSDMRLLQKRTEHGPVAPVAFEVTITIRHLP